MPAVSAGNQTKLRYPYHAVANVHLNLFPKVIKGTALINAPGGITYPTSVLPIDTTTGDWDNVREQELFTIEDGSGNIVFTGTHRRNPSSTQLRLNRISNGQDQRRRFQLVNLADNYLIKSYSVQIPGSFISRADETVTPVVIYKRDDIELNETSPQTAEPKPQINIGAWQQVTADPDTGVGTFTLSASNSFSFLSGTLSYLWELPSGMTIVSGMSTSATITVEAEPGAYIIACRGEDSAISEGNPQRQMRAFRYIWINDPTDYPSYSDLHAATIDNDVEDLDNFGREITITAYGQGAVDALYVGCPALLTYDVLVSQDGETWGALDSGLSRRTFMGFVRTLEEITNNADAVIGVTFKVVSPLKYYQSLPIAGQHLEAVSSVTHWQQTTAALGHVGYAARYTMEFSAPVSHILHDFYIHDSTAFKRRLFAIKGGGITDAASSVAKTMLGFLAQTSDGAIRLRRNPNVEGTTYRNALANVWTWADTDVLDELSFNYEHILAAGEYSGTFNISSSTEEVVHEGRFGLWTQAQGIGKPSNNNYIALSLNDGLDRLGHLYAMENNPVEKVTVKSRGLLGEFVDTGWVEWHTLNIAAYDPAVTGLFSRRVLPKTVNRRWNVEDDGSVTLDIEWVGVPETFGQRATEYIRPSAIVIPPPPPPSSFCNEWTAIGATPSGWADAGAVSTSGWAGDTTGVAGTYYATRSDFANWTAVGSPNANLCGIIYTPPEPLDVTTLFLRMHATVGPSKRAVIAVELDGGGHEILVNHFRGSPNTNTTVDTPIWTGVRTVVKIYFLARAGSGGGVNISRTWINCT